MKNPSTFSCTEECFDLVVCGGGVGGNACSEIGVGIEGAYFFGFFANMREGGPVEELKERIAELDPSRQYGQNSTASSLTPTSIWRIPPPSRSTPW